MLSKEQAREFLKTMLKDNFKEKAIEQVNKLSGKSRRLGLLLLNEVEECKDKLRYGGWPSVGEKRILALKEILRDELKGKDVWSGDHFKVMKALFGDWAAYAKKAWELESNMMYQVG